jgi:hypothetical protein
LTEINPGGLTPLHSEAMAKATPTGTLHLDRETWASALAHVDQFGSTAIGVAARRVLETVGSDDLAERVKRAHVALAVVELQRIERYRDELVN